LLIPPPEDQAHFSSRTLEGRHFWSGGLPLTGESLEIAQQAGILDVKDHDLGQGRHSGTFNRTFSGNFYGSYAA
jgi:hypothetical protein